MKRKLLCLLLFYAIEASQPLKAQVIAAGQNHSLAVCSDGTAQSWGYNMEQQLANGNNLNSNVPVQVTSLTGIVAVAGGYKHSLFLKSDGTVWACGWGGNGQLGDTAIIGSDTAMQVSSLTGITAIAAGWGHSLF